MDILISCSLLSLLSLCFLYNVLFNVLVILLINETISLSLETPCYAHACCAVTRQRESYSTATKPSEERRRRRRLM